MKAAAPLPTLEVDEGDGGKLNVDEEDEAERGGVLGLDEVDKTSSCGRGERQM